MSVTSLFPESKVEGPNPPVEAVYAQLMRLLESLDHSKMSQLEALYADDISYEDPNRALQGKKSMLAYLSGFLKDKSISVRIHTTMEQEGSLFMSWSARVRQHHGSRSYSQRLEGASFFRAREGKIFFQRNYFDESLR